jgi:hypothetical protein
MAKFPSRSKLHHAFVELEGKGYIAPRQAWQCCQGCGCAALPEGTTKYVFYHEQDFDHWKERGVMYIAWSGDAAEIVEVLRRHGCIVTHDNPEHRIKVLAKMTPTPSNTN